MIEVRIQRLKIYVAHLRLEADHFHRGKNLFMRTSWHISAPYSFKSFVCDTGYALRLHYIVKLHHIFDFLNHVRHHISEGKLPRLSFSAQSLLYSIDVGLDNVYRPYSPASDQFSDDWLAVQDTILNDEKFLLWSLGFLDKVTPNWISTFRYNYGWVSARKDKRSVYMLMSFIDAHEHAQKKIHVSVSQLYLKKLV
jgi:hypothetical protein